MKYPKIPSLFSPLTRSSTMGSASSSSSAASSSSSSSASASSSKKPKTKSATLPRRQKCLSIDERVPVLPMTCIRPDEERGRSLSPRRTTSTDERFSSDYYHHPQRLRAGYPHYDEPARRPEPQGRKSEEKKKRFRRSLGTH